MINQYDFYLHEPLEFYIQFFYLLLRNHVYFLFFREKFLRCGSYLLYFHNHLKKRKQNEIIFFLLYKVQYHQLQDYLVFYITFYSKTSNILALILLLPPVGSARIFSQTRHFIIVAVLPKMICSFLHFGHLILINFEFGSLIILSPVSLL